MLRLIPLLLRPIPRQARNRTPNRAPNPIRNALPNMGGIDISPVIVILIIIFIQWVVLPNLLKLFL